MGRSPALDGLIISVLGGTGAQGRGLALRFAEAGFAVVIGSRNRQRAEETARAVAAATGGRVQGSENEGAARVGDVVLVVVPWAAHRTVLTDLSGPLAGKIVVDCVNPLGFDEHGAYALPVEEGSAAEQAAALLPESRVVAAFHHISAARLHDPATGPAPADVLVIGQDRNATETVRTLVDTLSGLRSVYAGPLRNAHQVEAFTATLIGINQSYQVHSGLRVTDV